MKKTFADRIMPFSFIILVVVSLVVFVYFYESPLSRQGNFIRALELPHTIEMIAIISARGDSGGNSNRSTLRSVMLVKTELPREDIIDVFTTVGFSTWLNPFDIDRNLDYPIISKIIEPSSYQFSSLRNFHLIFDELIDCDTFDGFYFIEFIN
ncbi:MAG: hypothetical protein FWE33_02645 [Defluviitaleaceae bacterium]|nr:hypothetical protein [Defluviitaleaceae bacterium]